MREDMYELIIERPRWGSRWLKYPRRAKRVDAKVIAQHDPDKLPANVGMKIHRIKNILSSRFLEEKRYV